MDAARRKHLQEHHGDLFRLLSLAVNEFAAGESTSLHPAADRRWREAGRKYTAALTAYMAKIDALREAVGEMWAALAELVEVAGLRGDSTLPNPCDDPLLWTVRMQEAWDAAEEAVAKHTPTQGAPEVPGE